MKPPTLLLTIPAYQESGRLPRFLESLLPALETLPASVTVQVVDDGSPAAERDACQTAVNTLRSRFPSVEFLPLPANHGKGGAILAGWRHRPEADFYAFVDADGAIPAREVRRLVETALTQTAPVTIFSSRIKMLGRTIERTHLRHWVGRIYATLVGVLICPDIYDSQCGFKIVPAAHFRQIESSMEGHRFAFDVELLAALESRALPIVEVPIDWYDIAGSKVSILRDSVRMAGSIMAIRKKLRKNH